MSNPYYMDPPPPPPLPDYQEPSPEPLKHSVLGIISFICGLVVGLEEFFTVAIAGYMAATQKGPEPADNSPAFMLVGLFVCGGILLALIGAILGVVGLFGPRKRIFAILGLVINGLVLLGVLGLMILGMAAKR